MKTQYLEKVARTNKVIRLRTTAERLIEGIWYAASCRKKSAVERLKEQYQKIRPGMVEIEIPLEDIESYDQRINQVAEIFTGRRRR